MSALLKSNRMGVVGAVLSAMALLASVAVSAAEYEGGQGGGLVQRQPAPRQPDRTQQGRDERRHDDGDARRGERHFDREPRFERHHDQHRARPPVWWGDIRYFDNRDLPRWRRGAWRFARHNGELSWWWVVGGMWYPYWEPVYPYPDPYIPPVIIQTVPEQPEPPMMVPAEPSVPSWYYCQSAQGYYPYVALCPEGWQAVPATPPGAPYVPQR